MINSKNIPLLAAICTLLGLFSGCASEPDSHLVSAPPPPPLTATKELLGIARLKIHPGKLEEFKRLQAKCLELARTKDTGTLQYDCFFSSDYTECVVVERYRDSDALLEHLKNLGETAAAIFKTCSAAGEVCGTPSPELMKALEGSPVRMFSPYLSMQRSG